MIRLCLPQGPTISAMRADGDGWYHPVVHRVIVAGMAYVTLKAASTDALAAS